MKVHESVTADRVLKLVKRSYSTLDNPGICLACGEETEGVEPDARRYECDSCGKMAVYGAEEALFHVG